MSSPFPSVFEAEKRHKEKQEDKTTSRLFGYIGRLSPQTRDTFLGAIGFHYQELSTIQLWYPVQADGSAKREIDAVLKFLSTTVIVENKFQSQIDTQQLKDEFRLAQKAFGDIRLATITRHPRRPSELEEVQKQLGIEIIWTNWTKCLQIAKMLAENPQTDSESRKNLNDLVDYLETQEVRVQPGFSREDNWSLFHRLMRNSEMTINRIEELVKAIGYPSTNDEWPFAEYSGLTFWGRWIYKDRKKEQAGFWVAIGHMEGANQIEFSYYENSGRRKLRYLEKKGYALNQKFWSKGYDYFSKYLPMAKLQSDNYEEQECEIITFIKSCLLDRFNMGDNVWVHALEEPLPFESKVKGISAPEIITVEVTDKKWKKPSRSIEANQARIWTLSEADLLQGPISTSTGRKHEGGRAFA